MFLVRLADDRRVIARRKTEGAAQQVIDRRRRSCPARFEIVEEAPRQGAREAAS